MTGTCSKLVPLTYVALMKGCTPEMSRSPAQPRSATRWPDVIRAWPVWKLQPRLRWYVLAVIVAGAVAIGIAAAFTPWRPGDGLLYGILLAFGAVTVETARRTGEAAGGTKDAQGVWEVATALLLPPFFALTAPIVIFALLQWRVRRSLAYRRVFSAAAVGLATGAASLAFHTAWHGPPLLPVSRGGA